MAVVNGVPTLWQSCGVGLVDQARCIRHVVPAQHQGRADDTVEMQQHLQHRDLGRQPQVDSTLAREIADCPEQGQFIWF